MKNGNSKTAIIILCIPIALSFLAVIGIFVWYGISAFQGSDNNLFYIINAMFLIPIIFFLFAPLSAIIGYEGATISSLFSPEGPYFWFYLVFFVNLACVIALIVILSKRNKKRP